MPTVWTPDQQRTTPQLRRAAQHPGNISILVRAFLDPRHHVAELGADLLDRVLSELGAGRLERGWLTLFSSIQSRANLPD